MKKILLLLSGVLLMSFGVLTGKDYVTFTANIANRNGDAVYILNGKALVKKIQVNKDGVFTDTLKVKPGFYTFFDGKEYSNLYLKNGYDLKMKMDAAKFDETMSYTGTGAEENNYLAEGIRTDAAEESKVTAMQPEEVLKFIAAKKENESKALAASKFDAAFVEGKKQMTAAELGQMEAYFKQKMTNGKMNNSVSPSFNYENFKGGKTKLEDFRGKYVYIDNWATWCGPCRGEIPFLQKIEDKYKGKNIEFVSISVDEMKNHDKWKTFVTDKSLGGTQLMADKDWNSEFIKAYGINSIPRFILIGPDGKIVDADAKRPSDPGLALQLDGLLK